MNAIYLILTNPLFTKILSVLADKFLEWEKTQGKSNFKASVKAAIEKHDQSAIDGGNSSTHEGVKERP